MIDNLMHNTIQIRSQHCQSNNSASNSSNSLQKHDISHNSLLMNLFAVNHIQKEKLNVKQQCSNTFTSILQDLNIVLQQVKKN